MDPTESMAPYDYGDEVIVQGESFPMNYLYTVVYPWVTMVCGGASLVFNGLFIIVTMSVHTQMMSPYRVLLILYSLSNMAVSLTQMLAQPLQIVTTKGHVLFLCPGPLRIWEHFVVLMPTLNFLLQYNVLLMLLYQFVFKFITICTDCTYLVTSKLFGVFACILHILLLIEYAIPLFGAVDDAMLYKNEVREAIAEIFEKPMSIPHTVTGMYWKDMTLNIYFVISLINATPVILVLFIIIFILAVFVINYMRRHAHSTQTQSFQKQIMTAMILQAFLPFFLTHVPSFIGGITAFYGISLGFYSELLPLFQMCYPMLDPLIILLCIENYRTRLFRVFCFTTRRQKKKDTVVTVNSFVTRSVENRSKTDVSIFVTPTEDSVMGGR